MRGISATLGLAAAAFAGLDRSFEKGVEAMRDFGAASIKPRQGKPGARIARRAEYARRRQMALRQPDRNGVRRFEPGAKLARKAAEGRVGLTLKTRGTMATPSALKPFSMRGLPPLTPLAKKPTSHRQRKKAGIALGLRSTPNCKPKFERRQP